MPKTTITLLQKGAQKLKILGLSPEEAEVEARILLAEALKIKPLEIYVYDKPLTEAQISLFERYLEERLCGKPLAYVLGEVEFFGRRFAVSPGVLIPRPETEILVETVLQLLPDEPFRLCELGVGSGVISLTLALERPAYCLVAIEKSTRALEVARQNRCRWGLEARVHLVRGDWLSPLKKGPFFRGIVSNPPYVAPEEWEDLPREVREYEPEEALFADEQGLFFIRRTLEEAPYYLEPRGFVFLEIGYNQAPRVKRLAESLGYEVSFERDLLGYRRVLVARVA
jgi:release factor glutamine methyltransferase